MKFTLRDLPKYESIQTMAKKYPDIDPSAIETWLTILQATSNLSATLDRYLAHLGISEGRFVILMLLNRDSQTGISPSAIAEKAGVSRATVTGLIDGLERDGMVERAQDPGDRRSITVKLTDKGMNFLNAMLPGHFKRIAKLMSLFSKSDRKELIGLLNRLIEGLSTFSELKVK